MKPVDQTLFGGEEAPFDLRGDCFAACVATVLEVPLARVPNFCANEKPTWQELIDEWLRPLGLWHVCLEVRDDWRPPAGALAIAAGPGPRGHRHCVVYRGGEMVHDPHPSRDGLVEVDEFSILVQIEPFGPKADPLGDAVDYGEFQSAQDVVDFFCDHAVECLDGGQDEMRARLTAALKVHGLAAERRWTSMRRAVLEQTRNISAAYQAIVDAVTKVAP